MNEASEQQLRAAFGDLPSSNIMRSITVTH